MSRYSPRDELLNSSLSGTQNSLLRLVGGWGTIGGPGIFMIRALTAGTIASLFTGITAAVFSAILYDTAGLPFVICSSAGFVVGTFGFYWDSVRKSLTYLDRYPRLLQLHLDANFPHRRFDLWTLEQLRSRNFGSWQLRSMLIVGWLSAIPAIEGIVDLNEQKEMEKEADAAATETGASEREVKKES